MTSLAVPPSSSRLIVKRGGSAITRTVPKPTVIVDTREQDPLNFANFGNWVAGEQRGTLPVADYSIVGMEGILAMERKSLNDLVVTLMHNRERFFAMCEKLSKYPYRCILVEASYEDVKSPYSFGCLGIVAHPNGVSGSLDAVEAKWNIPVIYTSQLKHLAEEKAASWLSKQFTYWWLETQGMGRFLQDGDL